MLFKERLSKCFQYAFEMRESLLDSNECIQKLIQLAMADTINGKISSSLLYCKINRMNT